MTLNLIPNRTYDVAHTTGHALRLVTLELVAIDHGMAVFQSEARGAEFIPVRSIVTVKEVETVNA